MTADTVTERNEGALLRWARVLGALLSVGCVAGALHAPWRPWQWADPWWLLAAALVVGVMWQLRLPVGARAEGRGVGGRWPRVLIGAAMAAGGAALWAWASRALFDNWMANFDRAWIAWVAAAVCLAVGLDIASGPWRSSPRNFSRWRLALLVTLVLAAAAYRLGNINVFPGEGTATQVEDLQTGLWGYAYQKGGGRLRWEYLSHEWLAGLGIWLGGPTLTAMRVPFATVSVLKTVPLFLWLQFAVGPVGAVVGTALYVFSAWDVVLSRIPNNHNALVVAMAFALLAGPARRGRPSAYVWLGLFGGYVLFEYVAYRPLTFFVLVGATWLSLRDASAHWLARVARPLVTLVLIASMAVPLFHHIPPGRIWQEYFNGWNRARAQSAYYDPNDTWDQSLQRRIDRSFQAASLFFFTGDSAPPRRVNQSLVDPVTATLLLLGIGCTVAHLTQPIFALTLAGFLVTIAGTLILTGNFDVGRAGGLVPYAYALAGYGAASIGALCRVGRKRLAQMAVIGLSALAVVAAGFLNTRALLEYWSSRETHQSLRSNLALFSSWLRDNVRADERLVAIAPGYFNALQANDASWLRDRDIDGVAAWDIESALRYWVEHPGRALLVVFAGQSTPAVSDYLEWLLPGLKLERQPDPLDVDGDLAYARLDAPSPQLEAALANWHCRGVNAEYQLIGAQPAELLWQTTSVAPFIDGSTFPGAVRGQVHQSNPQPSRVLARFNADIVLPDSGEYYFWVRCFPGDADLRIDGQLYRERSRIRLEAGAHALDLRASFHPVPSQMGVRLSWSGPGTGATGEIVPIYRMKGIDRLCEPVAGEAAAPLPEARAGGPANPGR